MRPRLRDTQLCGADPGDQQGTAEPEGDVDMTSVPAKPTRALAVGLTPLETRRDVVLHVASRAEQLGYDAFCLAEGWGHDAPVLLAEVATRTSRIRLGTGVLNVWGRSAASLAMLATTLDAV